MDTKLFLMLVFAFLLGYYSRQLCSGVVEGLTCGGVDCGPDEGLVRGMGCVFDVCPCKEHKHPSPHNGCA